MTPADLHAFRLRLQAEDPAELPCLPTVMFRSVFGKALRQLACREPDREKCAGCARTDGCAYVTLFEPCGEAARPLGVTDVAPPPLLMSPEAPTSDDAPVRLAKGGHLDLRMALIGPARAHADLAMAALRAGLARGVGRDRAALQIAEVHPMRVTLAAPSNAAEIELVTPLRLTAQGKVRSRFSAEDLAQGLARRVRTLDALYAGGLGDTATDGASSWQLGFEDARVIHVRRWSGRQKAGMDLPGLVGRLTLRGDLAAIWPSLALGEWVHVGKGTSMGFGRYRLRAVA